MCFILAGKIIMKREILHKYFEGRANSEEKLAIKAWLDSSAENKGELLKERKIFDSILLNSHLSGATKEAIVVGKRKAIWWELFKIAAVAMLTFGIYTLYNKTSQFELNQVRTMSQTISVPPGQYLNVTLADGTTVHLNANTKIKYPANFGVNHRELEIDGQAFFDVAKNEKIPFIVTTKYGSVQALGTKFDVLAYSKTEEFEVALMSGKVKVSFDKKISDKSVILEPGQKSILADGILKIDNIESERPYQWKTGIIAFEDKSFGEIVKTFEQVYDVKINIHNKSLLDQRYAGKFRTTDGVMHALKVLQKDSDFEIKEDDKNQTIQIY